MNELDLGLSRLYFHRVRELGHDLNFFCSAEYFHFAGWEVKTTVLTNALDISVVDAENRIMLPVLRIPQSEGQWELRPDKKYWCGFSSMYPAPVFLDHEFIYNPSSFMDLSGSQWGLTRKNLKRCQKALVEEIVLKPMPEQEHPAVLAFLSKWVKQQEGKVFYDNEVMVAFLLHGQHRLILQGESSGTVFGILVWDENSQYVNFRYCAVDSEVPHLSEYARVEFYRYMYKEHYKNVNDGGSLGSESLRWFKERLHPMKVNHIYSNEEVSDES